MLAAIGRGQLEVLAERVEGKRKIFARYRESLSDLPGIRFMPEPAFARTTRWLTCMTIDPAKAGTDRDAVIQELENNNIEARPTWKPMHLQPLYKGNECIGGQVAEAIFWDGICLPSGTIMTEEEQERVIRVVRGCFGRRG